MRPQLYTAEYIAALSADCAAGIYTRKPSVKYARAVAQLLLGTAAHESGGFRYTRQGGKPFEYMPLPGMTVKEAKRSEIGAWGIWQIESISVRESLRQLARRPAVAKRAGEWLVQDSRGIDILWLYPDPVELCRAMTISTRLCCLFARLHYLWRPGRIPDTLQGQAAYWKRHYNTVAGAGTVAKYLRDWKQHIERD